MLINAEELRAALLQDGEPERCIVCLGVISVCGLSPGYEGAWEDGEMRSTAMGAGVGGAPSWCGVYTHSLGLTMSTEWVACFHYCLCVTGADSVQEPQVHGTPAASPIQG